jgi:class III poly(R)-hydroxyalkanoic acid synthase PhaE subunit
MQGLGDQALPGRASLLRRIPEGVMTADPWGGWQAFHDAARSYLENAAKVSPTGAAQQFGDFLREQFAAGAQPWTMRAPSSPDIPAFGATREHQQRAQRMAQASQRMEAASRRLQRLWSDVLREAAAGFLTQLTAVPPALAEPQILRRLYDQWIDCAEQAYARTAHGEDFCKAQAELANASSQWRQEQQVSIEQWSKCFDLPTRSEINTLTRRLRAVEAQLRSREQPVPETPTRRAKRSKKKS